MSAELWPWAEFLWAAIGIGFVVYALTGGADLGAGVWDLLARGPRAEQQRAAVKHAIAPIWEANHVWLIFVIVVLFSAFPRAYSVIGTALHIPIGLALVGLVFRGAAFSFHAYGISSEGTQRRWSQVFAIASVVTPVFLGMCVAAVSSGEIRVEGGVVTSGWFAGWTSWFAVLTGGFALALFAFLSAVYLAAEAKGELARDFCRRAIGAELVAGLFAVLVFVSSRTAAPDLFAELVRSELIWPVQLATAGLAGATVYELFRGRAARARWYAAAQVGLVIVNWGLAMGHHFVRPDISIDSSGARPEVLPALTLAVAGGGLLLLPALYYLYRVFKLQR
jgi:cytochrome d ubiquinol oxidase subunit II